MTNIDLIKYKYQLIFCSLKNCSFEMYCLIRRYEKEEIENMGNKLYKPILKL